jgi:hypothetical protein
MGGAESEAAGLPPKAGKGRWMTPLKIIITGEDATLWKGWQRDNLLTWAEFDDAVPFVLLNIVATTSMVEVPDDAITHTLTVDLRELREKERHTSADV